MIRDVVALVGTEIHPFELGVASEVFGLDRSADGLPTFDYAVCSADQRPLRTVGGMTVQVGHGLERARTADLIVVPAWRTDGAAPQPGVVETLRAAVERGATVLSVCSGAFLLAAAGLLEGRVVTTHWYHADALLELYPGLRVERDRLYVEDGPVITSAGTAAGIDACLHLVRREFGARVANGFARRMVVSPHRDGGQAQFVETPVPTRRRSQDDLGSLLGWLPAHLDQPHTVEALAYRVHMSPRTFARRFTAATGTAPHQWLTRQRVLLAQQLLEEDRLDVEEVARRAGFSNGEALRHHFVRQLGTTPSSYRQRFSHRLVTA
ncbi:MAG TPA: helix-turn-helix domain-containing protein [Segeticoccus sp.]|uniref:helix-turn-helix domain-containing protein n=1 Tax=Segeticoccus sp. TaxID=2706531 RepID=UPI002D7F3237|nr:helix-turn-helix domain-containing protein [Segeticoccus sp.]HET8600136.1 helix-turn-helix domain-containing protein [Segeticoccus sp.]